MMFESIAALASSAIGFLVDRTLDAGKRVAGKTIEAAGERLLSWMKGKLIDETGAGALKRFEAEPESEGAQQMLKGVLMSRLEKDEALVCELTGLLQELGAGDHSVHQEMSQSGSENVGTQVSGSGNRVDVRQRK